VSDQPNASAALDPGKEPGYPLDRRLGGLQIRYGRGGEEKKIPLLLGIEPKASEIFPLRQVGDFSIYTSNMIMITCLQTW
jgi:hypothetical protein